MNLFLDLDWDLILLLLCVDYLFHKRKEEPYVIHCIVPPKYYVKSLYYSFSISSLDNPVAPIINSIAVPDDFR